MIDYLRSVFITAATYEESHHPQPQVYQAMADNLGLAWRDLNNQLEQRKLVLHQAVMFHRTARTLLEKLTRAEMEFGNSFIPHDVQKCQQLLDQLRATRLGEDDNHISGHVYGN